MSDITLLEAKEELADVAGVSGMKGSENKFVKVINQASRELMDMHDWPDLVNRFRFSIIGNLIILPFGMRKITHVLVERQPVEMRSPWLEFVNHGPGEIDDDTWCKVMIQRNRTPVLKQPPATGGPWKIRVKTKTDETFFPPHAPKLPDVATPDPYLPHINVRGLNGVVPVVSDTAAPERIRGENIRIDSVGSPITGAEEFTKIESISKPYTNGEIDIFAVNTTSLEEVLLSTYHPYERTPAYKQYIIPGLSDVTNGDAQTVLARVRDDYIPVYKDDDLLSFGSMEALRLMVIAVHKKKSQRLSDYLNYREMAKTLQLEHEASSEMKTKSPNLDAGHAFDNGATEIEEVY